MALSGKLKRSVQPQQAPGDRPALPVLRSGIIRSSTDEPLCSAPGQAAPASRDWLMVQSDPQREGLVLTKTPWEIAVRVAHHEIRYGLLIEEAQFGYVQKCLKQTIFRAVRDTLLECSHP